MFIRTAAIRLAHQAFTRAISQALEENENLQIDSALAVYIQDETDKDLSSFLAAIVSLGNIIKEIHITDAQPQWIEIATEIKRITDLEKNHWLMGNRDREITYEEIYSSLHEVAAGVLTIKFV